MQPAWKDPRYSQLLHRIQLLHHLNEVPRSPQSNPLPTETADSTVGRRSLSFRHEKDLVEMFAYIAAVTDDPKRVAAVCLEEHIDERCLQICVAINHGGLEQLLPGLEAVARVLEACAKQGITFRLPDLSLS